MQIDNLWLSVGAHLQPKAALIVKASEGAGVETILNPPLQLWRWQFYRYDSTWEKLQWANQTGDRTTKKQTISRGEQVSNQ